MLSEYERVKEKHKGVQTLCRLEREQRDASLIHSLTQTVHAEPKSCSPQSVEEWAVKIEREVSGTC